jgi:Tfp pilus assembly protein PilV
VISSPRLRAPAHPRRTRAGFTLLEACLAFGVLAVGLLAMGQLQAAREGSIEGSRERGHALRLAQAELERLRLLAALEPAPTATSLAGPATLTRQAGAAVVGSREAVVTVDLAPHPSLQHQSVRVTVAWHDRHGREQSVRLDTLTARVAP